MTEQITKTLNTETVKTCRNAIEAAICNDTEFLRKAPKLPFVRNTFEWMEAVNFFSDAQLETAYYNVDDLIEKIEKEIEDFEMSGMSTSYNYDVDDWYTDPHTEGLEDIIRNLKKLRKACDNEK